MMHMDSKIVGPSMEKEGREEIVGLSYLFFLFRKGDLKQKC